MSYSGVQPTFGTFPSDLFTGNGSNTVFTLSSVPGNKAALLISIDGVRQHTDTYSYSANTLSFSEAPPSGAIIEAINMGSRADVVVTDGVYRKSQFTATAAQTNFNIATGYTIGFVDVYLNGIRLVVGDDYTANDGSTIILAVAAAAGDAVEVVAYGTFNVANALLKSGDTMSGNLVVSGTSIMATPHAIANTTGNTVVFANTGVVTFNANTIHVGAATFSNAVSITSTITETVSPQTAIETTVLQMTDSSAINYLGSIRTYNNGGYNQSLRIYTTNLGGAKSNEIKAMELNGNGYVTMPYQPAFSAVKTANVVNGTGTYTSWPTVHVNVGNSFNATTGVFTAPIAGVYQFTVSAMASGTGYINVFIYKNGTSVVGGGARPANSTYDQAERTIMLSLAVGDTVYVSDGVGGNQAVFSDSNGWLSFLGRLVG